MLETTENQKKDDIEDVVRDARAKFPDTLEAIRRMRTEGSAPVDQLGVFHTSMPFAAPNVRRFHHLIGLLLSAQTRDEVTSAAMLRLHSIKCNVETLSEMEADEIADIIKPVCFHNNKAKYIKMVCEVLKANYKLDEDEYKKMSVSVGVEESGELMISSPMGSVKRKVSTPKKRKGITKKEALLIEETKKEPLIHLQTDEIDRLESLKELKWEKTSLPIYQPDTRDKETRDMETRDKETRDMDTRDMETRDMETRDMETRDMDTRDMETRDKETRDMETRDKETRDMETRDKETRDMETRDMDTQDKETQDKETRDMETRDKETREMETRDKETRDKETREMETRDKETRDKETRDGMKNESCKQEREEESIMTETRLSGETVEETGDIQERETETAYDGRETVGEGVKAKSEVERAGDGQEGTDVRAKRGERRAKKGRVKMETATVEAETPMKMRRVKLPVAYLTSLYDVPRTYKEATQLPGVGPKMATLFMVAAWGECVGIGVDLHVHRVSNRLAWVMAKTPEKTKAQLESFVPQSLWREFNKLVVGFGQQRCTAQSPACSVCEVSSSCPFFSNLLPPPTPKKEGKKRESEIGDVTETANQNED